MAKDKQAQNLRATRIAAVQEALMQRRAAAKSAAYEAAAKAHAEKVEAAEKLAAYREQCARLAAEMGVVVKGAGVRTSTAATPTAPRTGVTKQVWELAAQHGFDRKATLAACEALGINSATAKTQYALAKRASLTAPQNEAPAAA